MDATEFKPGDLVRVKSGGPIMTVEQVGKTAMLEEDAVLACCRFRGQSVKLIPPSFRTRPG